MKYRIVNRRRKPPPPASLTTFALAGIPLPGLIATSHGFQAACGALAVFSRRGATGWRGRPRASALGVRTSELGLRRGGRPGRRAFNVQASKCVDANMAAIAPSIDGKRHSPSLWPQPPPRIYALFRKFHRSPPPSCRTTRPTKHPPPCRFFSVNFAPCRKFHPRPPPRLAGDSRQASAGARPGAVLPGAMATLNPPAPCTKPTKPLLHRLRRTHKTP